MFHASAVIKQETCGVKFPSRFTSRLDTESTVVDWEILSNLPFFLVFFQSYPNLSNSLHSHVVVLSKWTEADEMKSL